MTSTSVGLRGAASGFRNARVMVDNHESDFRKEFVCPEESMRYASSLEQLLFNGLRDQEVAPTIIEFGSGTGEAVISAILKSTPGP